MGKKKKNNGNYIQKHAQSKKCKLQRRIPVCHLDAPQQEQKNHQAELSIADDLWDPKSVNTTDLATTETSRQLQGVLLYVTYTGEIKT